MNITLQNNLTEFDGVTYRQEKGTAIGPKDSCDYADTSMNYIDDRVNSTVVNIGPPKKPLLYKRYRDDIWIIWVHGRQSLEDFTLWLNSLNSNLKFTMCAPSNTSIEYLDTYIYLVGHTLHTKVHSKPCDSHSYLIPSSCHATHIIENIPKGIAHRLYRIHSEQHNYESSVKEYTGYLEARGYHKDNIAAAFNEIANHDRMELVRGKGELAHESKSSRCFPLVCDFNPALPNVTKVLNKHKYILELDDNLKGIIPSSSIFASFRKCQTIQDMLVNSKLKPSQISNNNKNCSNILKGCVPCKNKKCIIHELYLKKTDTFKSYMNNREFKITSQIDCNTQGVIYMINDTMCKVSYVGHTTDSIKGRFQNHKSHIKKRKRLCELSSHFIDSASVTNDHGLDKSTFKKYDETLSKVLEIYLIEHVKFTDTDSEEEKVRKCRIREVYWQNQLGTMQIYGGLNKRDERPKRKK